MDRIILHLDMNSYFASCEQQDRLDWRGKPLGVCEHLGGIIIAASREAKRWGIKTGTPVWEAKRRYPKVILTKTNAERYRFYTRRWLALVSDYTGSVEQASIDEAFLDLTPVVGQAKDPWGAAAEVASDIKRRMPLEVGDWLTCSVGISDCKLVAKIASNLKKPDGLTVVRPEDKERLYGLLELTDIPGIGARRAARLKALGIATVRELRDCPLSHLVASFGVAGYHLHRAGQLAGSWKEPVEDQANLKSMGHMYTLERQFRDSRYLLPVLSRLCEMVAERLRRKRLVAGALFVGVRLGLRGGQFGRRRDHRWWQGHARLDAPTADGRRLFLEARELLREGLADARSCYLVAVTASTLSPAHEQLALLPDRPSDPAISQALDRINARYGPGTATRAESWLAQSIIRDSVGFGRIKER